MDSPTSLNSLDIAELFEQIDFDSINEHYHKTFFKSGSSCEGQCRSCKSFETIFSLLKNIQKENCEAAQEKKYNEKHECAFVTKAVVNLLKKIAEQPDARKNNKKRNAPSQSI